MSDYVEQIQNEIQDGYDLSEKQAIGIQADLENWLRYEVTGDDLSELVQYFDDDDYVDLAVLFARQEFELIGSKFYKLISLYRKSQLEDEAHDDPSKYND